MRYIIPSMLLTITLAGHPIASAVSQEWKMVETADDFGDSTGKRVVYGKVKGTFENSATNNSNCSVEILLYENQPKNLLRIAILEYGRSPITPELNEGIGRRYTLKTKDSEGEIRSFGLSGVGKQLAFDDTPNANANHFLTMLLERSSVKCVIEVSKSVTEYQFTLSSEGFRDAVYPIVKEQLAKYEAAKAQAAKAAKEVEEREKANMLAKEAAERKKKQPMLFETNDKKFTVTAICIGSNRTHVRLKRVDNGKDLTIERSLLSEETNRLIKERTGN
ncbi:hypothetical protein OAH34_02830 [bacterium]|nr:hypothetical protein [bacterium]